MKPEGKLISELINEIYDRSLLTSWSDFARRIGVSHQTVGQYRKGNVVPKAEVSARIAKFAGVTLEEIEKYKSGLLTLTQLLDEKHEKVISISEVMRSVPYYEYGELAELLIEIGNRLRNYRCAAITSSVQSSSGVREKKMYSDSEYISLLPKHQRRLRGLLFETAIKNGWTTTAEVQRRDIDAYSEAEVHYVAAGVDMELCRKIFLTDMNGVHRILLTELAVNLYKVESWNGDTPVIGDEKYQGYEELVHDLDNHTQQLASVY